MMDLFCLYVGYTVVVIGGLLATVALIIWSLDQIRRHLRVFDAFVNYIWFRREFERSPTWSAEHADVHALRRLREVDLVP